MRQETVIVLDFGGQYNQLIARRVRECGVYCEVKPYTTPISELRSIAPIGLILTGGPGQRLRRRRAEGRPGHFRARAYPCSASATAASSWRSTWAGASYRRRTTPRASTAARRPSLTPAAPSSRPARRGRHLDEPRRLHGARAGGFQEHRTHRRLPQRGHSRRGPRLLRRAVPPRGQPHRARHGHDTQLPLPAPAGPPAAGAWATTRTRP